MDVYDELPSAFRTEAAGDRSRADYPRVHAYKLAHELRPSEGLQPNRTAAVVRHPDFGAAILVTDGSGNPFYVPKDKKGLVQLILDAAQVLRELP